jgi:hypothetical protein
VEIMTNGNPNVDSILNGLDTGLSPGLENIISEANAGLPFDAPPPPDRRPAARAPANGPSNGSSPFGGSSARGETKQLENAADQAAAKRASPLLAKKFGELAKRVPGADRVRIRKRLPDGTSWMVNDWLFRDIGIDDIESFVVKFVKPSHGGGQYDVVLLDSIGREFDAGFVRILNEPEGAKGGDAQLVGVVTDLIQRNQTMMLQMQQPQPQQDPIDQMRRVRELSKEFGGEAGGGGGMAMAMMMMQSQQRGPDPMLMSMLQAQQQQMQQFGEVLKEIKNGAGQAMMPPPPPPPAFDMVGLTALLSTVAVPLILEFMKNSAASRHDPSAISKADVQLMMTELQMRLMQSGEAPPNPLEVAKETIALFRELHGGEKQQSLQEKLAEMQALRELAKEVVGGTAADAAARSETNFWDAAVGLMTNKALGEGFGKMLGTAMDRFGPGSGGGSAPAPGPVVTLNSPARMQQARPVGNLPGQPQAQPQPQQAPQPQIEIPDDFPAMMEKIETASEDRGRIEAVVNAVYSLRGHEQWKAFVHGLLGATAKNEKDAALRGLHNWLKLIVGNNLLSAAAGDRVMKTFVSNWDAIHTTVAGMMGAAQAAAAPPAQAQAPNAPAPAGAPAEDDEEDETPDAGPPPVDVELPPDMLHGGPSW